MENWNGKELEWWNGGELEWWSEGMAGGRPVRVLEFQDSIIPRFQPSSIPMLYFLGIR
jgi:hypothetical protein